jgi:hypothetical protein
MAENQGDKGRLRYIMETLQKGKRLFNSDQIYLNKKISAEVIPEPQIKPSATEEKLKNVKNLISLNFGDQERLRYIFQRLQKNEILYHSDEKYLASKTEQITNLRQRKKIKQQMDSRVKSISKTKINDKIIPESISKKIVKEQPDESYSDKTFELPKEDKDSGSLDSNDKPEFFYRKDEIPNYNLEIESERHNISKLKLEDDQLKIQRHELSQLIVYRQEYEIKINHERGIVGSETKMAQEEIKNKDILVKELISNQSKIIQIRTEREVLVDQTKIFKTNEEREIEKRQKELEELKIIYDQYLANQDYQNLNTDDQITDGDSNKIKKVNLKKNIWRKIGISLVAIGLILGISAIIIKPAEFWVCDILEILNITLLSFC